MRRSLLAVGPLCLAMLVGCEDGPNQTFSPSPSGAGAQWNNGNSAPVVPTGTAGAAATQPFGNSYPTTGKTTICSTDLKRQRWAWMLNQPVIPPRFWAGIDIAKDDLWHGLTIEDAEAAPADPNAAGGGLCQSVPLGFAGGCPSGFGFCNTNIWGNNAEVVFTWNVATHKVDQMEIQLGYLGSLTMKSKDGANTYVIKVGDVIKKNDQPFLIDWNGNPAPQITELYNAAIATFGVSAGIPPDVESVNCVSEGNCLASNAGGTTIFGFRPLVIYFLGNSGVPQPALSTPIVFYNFYAKFEPYSYIPQVVNLGANGPVASGTPRGARDPGIVCTQQVGSQFVDFRKNCIQVHGPAGQPDMVDTANLNKVLFGLTHDLEHWTGSFIGINQNFTSEKVQLNPDLVVLDEDTPQDDDFAQDFFFDLRARGHLRNEYNDADKIDLRASAMIFVEWARLMLADVNLQMRQAGIIPKNQPPKKLGDPSCTGFDQNGNPNFAPGCSGLEGLIIPAIPGRTNFTKDASCANPDTCLDPGDSWDPLIFYGASLLKPGFQFAAFCVDPGSFTDCYSEGSAVYTAQAWVTRLLGRGNIYDLPVELRDRRYYYRWFAVAFMKYLKAYSTFANQADVNVMPCSTKAAPSCAGKRNGLGPTDVQNAIIDMESLFFDNNETGGTNGFDKFEYIDRDNIGKGQEGTPAAKYNWIPWDFEYGCDLIGGNQRYDNWFRRMDREEIALYSAMLVDKSHSAGQENNVNITNLFGSPLLAANWPTYDCAIGAGGDPAISGCPPPPLDTFNHVDCQPTGACDGNTPCQGTCAQNNLCVLTKTYETGMEQVCGGGCDFVKYPATGCAKSNQSCVLSQYDFLTEACVDMMMDLNGAGHPISKPVLSYYQSAWGRSPFAMGHSPITVHDADKRPNLGVAKITIPNFADGPYTVSPQTTVDGTCPMGWTLDGTKTNCTAPLEAGTGVKAPTFTPLVPWLEQQPGVGFNFPLDGQRDQVVTTAQLDFTGVLETYLVDYTRWIDIHKPSCVAGGGCNAGYTCNAVTKHCEASDDTINILAIESADFLGEVFLCQDGKTGDILHVRQYDSALAIIDWLAAHPGGWDPNAGGAWPSAQDQCQIIVKYSPYNNYIDFITSKSNGVKLGINQGAGLGRVVDVTLFDPSIPNTP